MEKKKNEKNKENLNKLEEEHKELKKVTDEIFRFVIHTLRDLNFLFIVFSV